MGLDVGHALANQLRPASVGRERVKPAMDANGEVKPTRRPLATNIRPICLQVGVTYRTAVCGPACTVVWEGRSREASAYPDFR